MADLTLHNLVATRLAEAPPTIEGAADLILAAFQGADALRATLDGHEAASVPSPQPDQAPTTTYLASIEVEGFRGIGPPVTLSLEPSPGLTLVVERNGSGKSSFAEALEMLITGSGGALPGDQIQKSGDSGSRGSEAEVQAGLPGRGVPQLAGHPTHEVSYLE